DYEAADGTGAGGVRGGDHARRSQKSRAERAPASPKWCRTKRATRRRWAAACGASSRGRSAAASFRTRRSRYACRGSRVSGGAGGGGGGGPCATLPEVEGRESARLAEVVSDEAGDETAVGGRVWRVEPGQVRCGVVQDEEVPVRLPRQPGERRGRRAGGAGDPALGHAEAHGVGTVGIDGRAVADAGPERRLEPQHAQEQPEPPHPGGIDRVPRCRGP